MFSLGTQKRGKLCRRRFILLSLLLLRSSLCVDPRFVSVEVALPDRLVSYKAEVPPVGSELLTAALAFANKLPNPTTFPRSRITTPEEANAEVASKSSGSCSSSDGGNIDCNTLLTRSICVRMLVLLVPSVNTTLGAALDAYWKDFELIGGLTLKRKSQLRASLDEAYRTNVTTFDVCGEGAQAAAARPILNEVLVPMVQTLLVLNDKGDRAETIRLIQMMLHGHEILGEEPDLALVEELSYQQRLQSRSFEGFENRKYGALTRELTDQMLAISSQSGESREGGLMVPDGRFPLDVEGLAEKRECFVGAVLKALEMVVQSNVATWQHGAWENGKRAVVHFLEVGFNAGHSAAMILAITENSPVEVRLTSLDLCHHGYSRPAAEHLRGRFLRDEAAGRSAERGQESRHELLCGDSSESMAGMADSRDREREKFGLVFIDGDHFVEGALRDLRAARRIARQGSIVIVDDCNDREVDEAWEVIVAEGAILPLEPGLCWRGLCIGTWT